VKSANLLEVVDLGRDLFVKHIIRPPIKVHVINAILSLLHIERDGYVINRSAITSCVDTLSKLSDSSDGMTVYRQYLEPEILCQSEAYYKAEAGRLLETCDTLEYLRRVNLLSLIVTAFLTSSPYTRYVRSKHDLQKKSRVSTSIYLYKP
jgi:cullin 3